MTPANADRERDIRERVAAATPGDWEWQEALYEGRYNALYAIDPQDDSEIDGVVIEETLAGMIIEKDADRDLIANAPADLAYLLARVAELTRDLDAARTALVKVLSASVVKRFPEDTAYDALDRIAVIAKTTLDALKQAAALGGDDGSGANGGNGEAG